MRPMPFTRQLNPPTANMTLNNMRYSASLQFTGILRRTGVYEGHINL